MCDQLLCSEFRPESSSHFMPLDVDRTISPSLIVRDTDMRSVDKLTVFRHPLSAYRAGRDVTLGLNNRERKGSGDTLSFVCA
jgi:hypothetical protein